MNLTLNQTRVIGCLIEKQKTTPDQYPLSLNALVLACNQKSNRDPVLELSELDVQETLDELRSKHLIREESGFGSRVVKYHHRFCNTEFSELKFTEQELAIISVLFLRGYQTPGELRSRTQRLCDFDDVHEVEAVLTSLQQRLDGPFVARMEREPGKRESRYAHLLSGDLDLATTAKSESTVAATSMAEIDNDRIVALEAEVVTLRQELAEVKAMLDELLN
tara:strand:+ start:1812 stop:2474 length:663 start_codon:yes stop_codon:yes gene_type:complete